MCCGLTSGLVVSRQSAPGSIRATALDPYDAERPPQIFGKQDLAGQRLLTEEGSITSMEVARAIAAKLLPEEVRSASLNKRLAEIDTALM